MKPEDKAVVQQTLEMANATLHEALEHIAKLKEENAALRQLLEAEPVQEPDIFPDEAYEMGLERIAYYTTPPAQPADHIRDATKMVDHGDELTIAYLDGVHTGKRLARREWVGLTDEEITLTMMRVEEQGAGYFLRLARAIEAKLREKNGGGA